MTKIRDQSGHQAVGTFNADAAILSVEHGAREFPSLRGHLGQPRRRPFPDMLTLVI